jgi:hypothetical protein
MLSVTEGQHESNREQLHLLDAAFPPHLLKGELQRSPTALNLMLCLHTKFTRVHAFPVTWDPGSLRRVTC